MYAIGTLSARFPDSKSTLKCPLVRLSVRVPVAKLPVRYQHIFGMLIQDLFGTLKRPFVRVSVHNVESSFMYAIGTLSDAQANFIKMQVDKAHVAVSNWPTEDFQEARLSDPCTLKRADTNSAQLKEFFFSFSNISFL